MKIGDKVRFLDSVGGGTVTGFEGKDVVLVEDEDGFDIPMLMHNCVVVDSDKEKLIKGETPAQPVSTPSKPTPEPEPADKPITYKPLVQERKGGDKLNLFLCFEPTVAKHPNMHEGPSALAKSKFDVYFINDSNYYITFTFLSGDNNIWMLRHIDTADPNTKIYIETINSDSLNELQHICVQLIAFKQDKTFMLKAPISSELRLDLNFSTHLCSPSHFQKTT